jgi:2-polyprenyl-3-methyl-5-hydroxy-6-metoxy-1,4-benzoquinol methylase
MTLESVTTCPICNGTTFDLFDRCSDFTTSKEEFSIVKCRGCNFLITNPRPDANSIGKYYKSDSYISHTNSSKTLIDKLYKVVRAFTLRWKLNLVNAQKPVGKILDYGCGTGEFLATCKRANWDCYGVEPSAEARKKATEFTNLPITRSLNEMDQTKFDIITLWHVLEHIDNLNEKLSELKSFLKEDGIIFIAVPNHESLDAKIYTSYWAGYDVPRHLWHFSQENIKRLFTSHQLHLTKVIPMKQDSFYVSILSEKYRYPNRNSLLNLMKGFIVGLRSNLAAGKNKNYSSLVYIART